MKVKISYTVDLQEIPDRVEPLFEQIVKNVNFAAESAGKLKSNKDTSIDGSLKHIDELRELLLESDLLLGDCYDMLSGYLNILTNNNQEESTQ